MRPSADGRLWMQATAVSMAIHAALAAGVMMLPEPKQTPPGVTAIDIQGIRTSLSEGVATAQHLAPAEVEKKAAEPVRDSVLSEPAEQDRKTLEAARTEAAAGAASAGRQVAAAEAKERRVAALASERRVLEGKAPTGAEIEGVAAEPVVAATAASADDARAVGSKAASVTLSPSSGGSQAVTSTPAGRALAPVGAPAVAASSQPRSEAAASRTWDAPVAALAGPERVPAASATGAAPAAVATAASAAKTVQASPDGAVVAPRPAAPVSAPAPWANAAGDRVAVLAPRAPSSPAPQAREIDPRDKMLDYLSLYDGGGCFLALASAGRDLSIDGFSGTPEEVSRLGREIADAVGVPVEARAHVVTRDQCGALDFARQFSSYPVPALDLRTDTRVIDSGDYLSGRIGNIRGNVLYLLLVDDEGKVEEIHDLFRDGDAIGFRTPMTLEDGPVETAQILVVLTSEEPLETVTSHDGAHADTYFAALAGEIARTGNQVDFGFAHFFVR